jgi:hypothetical protein
MKFDALRFTGRPNRLWITLFVSLTILTATTYFAFSHYRRQAKRGPEHFTIITDDKSVTGNGSDNKSLLRLCQENLSSHHRRFNVHDLEDNNPQAWAQVQLGIKRAERLLPTAKRLVVESLRGLPASFNVSSDELSRAQNFVSDVNTVVLDKELDNVAEFQDENPTEVHIGPEYGLYLDSDEETLVLLGHELTHAAEQDRNLKTFYHTVAAKVESATSVKVDRAQREDLSCDFIGEQVLKRYIKQNPTKESAATRLSRSLDYNCDNIDDSDDEHLSQDDTLTALLLLDPELDHLILAESR